MTRIDQDELMSEMMRLSIKQDAGRSAQEWAEAMGCSWKSALGYLNTANKLGRLKRGQRSVVRIDGRSCRIPVYSIVAKRK